MDKTIEDYPRWLLCLGVVRDSLIAKVLFHEWGHHLHYTQAPEFRDKEDVADEWARKLSRSYLRRRYWYLIPVAAMFRFVTWASGRRAS